MPSILYFGSGVKPWAKRLRGRGGILGEEAASHPPHQLQGLGERCKLTQWGPGRRPAAKRFSYILEAPHGISWTCWGPSSGGGGMAPCNNLKSAYWAPGVSPIKFGGLAISRVSSFSCLGGGSSLYCGTRFLVAVMHAAVV